MQVHTRYRHRGGEDTVVESERVALTGAGHEVVQHLLDNPDAALPAVAGLALSAWNPAAGRRARQAARASAVDVAHVHNTWFMGSPAVPAALHAARIPVVMTLHNFRLGCANGLLTRDDAPCELCLDGGTFPAVRHKCYRGSRMTSAVAAAGIGLHRKLGTWARYVDRFVVLSDFAAGRLARMGVPADRMVRGSNFVTDPGRRASRPSASREVLFVGRLSREKGVHVLLDAWAAAAPADLELVVVGDGPERDRLEAGAPAGVRFVGRLEPASVRDRMLRARALAVPSTWYEGQPLVALEALAAGLPLLLSDIGGLPEILRGSGGGLFAAPGDTSGWAGAIRSIAEDRGVDELGERARARFMDEYTESAAVARLESVYESARETATGSYARR